MKKNELRIVNIPEKMEKFYGTGKMLHPSVEAIEELISNIPKGYVTTIDSIAKCLAKEAGVDVNCPMRIGNVVKKISKSYSNENIDFKIPFWRVIRSNKEVIKTQNYEYWATLLEDEGFKLSYSKPNSIMVEVTEDKLFDNFV